MAAVEAVVFDIGNVLVEWDPERVYDAAIGPERRKALFEAVDLGGMNLGVDLGADLLLSVTELAGKHPEWGREIRFWYDGWIDMFEPEIPHSSSLLRALKAKGVPVFSLSNFGTTTFEWGAAKFPVLTEFDREYISGHLGVVKPDPRIYEMLERDCGVAPDRLLFADDRPENIEAAEARGWRVHLFDGPGGWADRLVAEGLLRPEEAAG